MSRIGTVPVAIPGGVTVSLTPTRATIKGPKGELGFTFAAAMVGVKQEGGALHVARKGNDRRAKAMHGTTQRLLKSMVLGVTKGYSKQLEIQGTGYRAEMKAGKLVCRLGHSHDIVFEPPKGIKIEVADQTKITVSGIDKQAVGQVAANIRSFRKPDVYQGKGVRYAGEYVRHKQGKTSK